MTGANIAQPDVTLRLDLNGVIHEATLSDSMSGESLEAWIGRPWVETVADLGSDKVRRMVEDARARRVSAFRQVTQCFPSGREVLIEYTTVWLGDQAGLIAVGKSLQAVTEMQSRLLATQQEMERDYWKHRELETRYRLLFDTSNDAVLLVRAANLRIVEANPAALRALGLAPQSPGVITGQEFLTCLEARDRQPVMTMLDTVRAHKRAPAIVVQLGQEHRRWLVRASLTESETGLVFLLQLVPALAAQPASEAHHAPNVEALIERMPDGFVVLDQAGLIRRVNRAFLDLVKMADEKLVLGQRLDRWLGRPGSDAAGLIAAVGQRGLVRHFHSVIRAQNGTNTAVEISAAGDSARTPQYVCAFLRDASGVRDSGRRLETVDGAAELTPDPRR